MERNTFVIAENLLRVTRAQLGEISPLGCGAFLSCCNNPLLKAQGRNIQKYAQARDNTKFSQVM